ncbi:hypothetical protein RIF29_39572 [Crotalaria pallida]|uniref:Uncharacterized protein n=1 Tax=Crotalaria pallida TaxID=3830 RepID=A0AAN9E299_CROPI
MAKKRGRPPKTPSSQSKKTVGKAGNNVGTPSKVDFGDLDDEDLDDINNLSPKQAELWMKKIDLLRAKIQERASNNEKSTKGSGEKEKDADQSNPNTEIPSSGNPLSDGVWDKLVVGSYMFQVCKKLISLQKPFRDLNKRAFKGIDSQELQIREELDLVQSAIMKNPDDTNLHSREKDMTRRPSGSSRKVAYVQGIEEIGKRWMWSGFCLLSRVTCPRAMEGASAMLIVLATYQDMSDEFDSGMVDSNSEEEKPNLDDY